MGYVIPCPSTSFRFRWVAEEAFRDGGRSSGENIVEKAMPARRSGPATTTGSDRPHDEGSEELTTYRLGGRHGRLAAIVVPSDRDDAARHSSALLDAHSREVDHPRVRNSASFDWWARPLSARG